jgi:hypothetical protein
MLKLGAVMTTLCYLISSKGGLLDGRTAHIFITRELAVDTIKETYCNVPGVRFQVTEEGAATRVRVKGSSGSGINKVFTDAEWWVHPVSILDEVSHL